MGVWHGFAVRFILGDVEKESMKARGITFEQVATAPVLDTLPNAGHPDQILLIVEIAGYVHAVPCERRGAVWRMITAYPSRKYHKLYRP